MVPQTRRDYVAALCGVALTTAGCTGVTFDGGRRSDEWSTFGYDAANAGYTPHSAPATAVEKRWRYDLVDDVVGGPAVVAGTAYVGDANGLHAVDAETGDREWRFGTDVPAFSVPTIADGTAYVGSDGLYAVDGDTGEQRWYFDTAGADLRPMVRGSPTVVDGTVYAGDYGVYALDAATGEELWHFETENLPETRDGARSLYEGFVDTAPAVAGGRVYVTSRDGNLYAMETETGEGRWRVDVAETTLGAPAVADGAVFVAGNRRVVAFDAETGEERWARTLDDYPGTDSSPAVADGTVYVSNGALVAIDAETGEERWRASPEDGFARFGDGNPAVADGIVVAGGAAAAYALDAESGEALWRREFGDGGPSELRGSPAVADGAVFVNAHDGALYALE